ncbi:C39 family peptidase [Companilactobacillus jidongensis]|uniref:C39 family peptidase n=1 Tax=Companilactobacillus jidongensis TaxID=2486006 RepID=UPI000F76E80A|nr:C39 family peptidase [Companilactobacillus jidongensis]
MDFKKKVLYATLFASSCLLSTNIAKADTIADTNNNQPTSQAVSEATQQTETNETAPETNTKVNSDQEQNDTNSSQLTQNTQQTEQTNVQQVQSVEKIDGVYSTNNQVTMLYQSDGTPIKNRALMANTAWYTNARQTMTDGYNYYRVATNEYANGSDGSYTPYVQPYVGNATVVYKSGSSIHDFKGYGSNAVYSGNDLPTGSNWKISNHVNVGGKEWYQIGNNTWVPQDYVVVNGGQYKSADWLTGVPLISQRPELPNGCEITAVTMMLQYAGAKVDKMQMAREMPRSGDPNYGYIGQPWDGTGITIFPPALMNLVEKYTGTAKNLTGQGLDAIKYQINIGHPVVTWNTLHGFPYHALTVTGYDSQYVYYNDCWTNQTTQMDINSFINNWNTQNRRAISY